MAQDHHALPQVYLRQWCTEHRLVRYRKVGPHARLVADPKTPKTVAYKPDLYAIPGRVVANGLVGHDLEQKLASGIDSRLANVVADVSAVSGIVADADVDRRLRWLLRTFTARSMSTIRRAEHEVAAMVAADRPIIERMAKRARTPKYQAELGAFLHSGHAAATVRAALSEAIAEHWTHPTQSSVGVFHVVHIGDVLPDVRLTGVEEFVTFEDPVVEWEDAPGGIIRTFALSPSVLVVEAPSTTPEPAAFVSIAVAHNLRPLRYRRSVFTSREAAPSTEFFAALSKMLSWEEGE